MAQSSERHRRAGYIGAALLLLVVFVPVMGLPFSTETAVAEGRQSGVADNTQTRFLADRLWDDLNLQRFYERITVLKFCFDFDSRWEVQQLLRETLPEEELVALNQADQDGICGDWDEMVPYICQDAEDYILYFQFVLRFDDPEKIPDTTKCNAANMTQEDQGCLPGFFKTDRGSHPCCEGFFCPQMMNCMIPCPLGANCPKAHSVTVPERMLQGLHTSVEEKICSPYGYQERSEFGCGGADKWDTHPNNPFFHVEDNRGHIYCPNGHFCEDTIEDPVQCGRGYYCRYGSVKASHCPPLTICDAGTSLPEDYFGMVFDGFMFVFLAVVWQASKYYNRIMRRLSARERIRLLWGIHPRWDVVQSSAEGPAAESSDPSTSSSAFARRPPRSSLLPKLVALQTFSSTLSRTFTRSAQQSESRRLSTQPPAVWASLSTELKSDAEDDHPSPAATTVAATSSENHPVEDLNFTAITIDFYGLGLKVRSGGKAVVSGASGKFETSKLTVLMGPSGCGKTSLLTFLACQGDYTMTDGIILINGTQSTLKKYRKVTGFVPQDDIVHPKLTVEENLCFSARYRLPKHTTRHDHLAVVDRAVQLLGVVEVRNQLVGNEESRGVSGGQRKRVNIGLELVADPWILFLDEPTSGLDASSCRQVMSALAKIAHMGVTCAAVVHQPSNRVMKLFDNVLLMERNGKTVYYGPQSTMRMYFSTLGFMMPSDENPADVYLEIITRPKKAPLDPELSLSEHWEASEFRARYLSLPAAAANFGGSSSGSAHDQAANTLLDDSGFLARIMNTIWMGLHMIISPFCLAIGNICRAIDALRGKRRLGEYMFLPDSSEEELRSTPGLFTQFWMCFYRCMLERTRSALRIFLEYVLYAVSGMILGILSDARTSGRLKYFMEDMNYNIVAIALMTTVGSLRTFSQNQLVFFRESRAGLNKFAYYCATALFGDVGSILKGLCYLSLYYSYAQPRALFIDMFIVNSATIYSCSGFGYLISKVLKPGPAQLTAAVFVLSNALLTRGRTTDLISFIRTFLYHRWSLEAYTISEAKQLFGVWSLERCGTLHAMNYDIRHFLRTIIALLVLGIITRILSFGMIIFGLRDKSE